ncbi:MAG: hypothetical protein AB1576_08660 [Bacillota bacterium]
MLGVSRLGPLGRVPAEGAGSPRGIGAFLRRILVFTGAMSPEEATGGTLHAVLVESVKRNLEVMEWAGLGLATGTSLANGTVDIPLSEKPMVFYGVTVAGAVALMDLERYRPCAC